MMFARKGGRHPKYPTMKRITLLLIALVAIAFASCTTRSTVPTKTTAGKSYDMFIFANDDIWQGELKYAVCDAIEADAPGLTRPEGYFNIVDRRDPAAATAVDQKYANILKLVVEPTIVDPTMSVAQNVYARPQTVVTIKAATAEALTAFVNDNAAAIRQIFEEAERTRSNTYNAGGAAELLMDDFKEHTGFEMLIPANFYKANPRDKSLLWYIRDYKNKAQYIFAFEYPYTDASDFTPEWLMRTLDNKLSTISSKGAAGSYMGVNENGPAIVEEVVIGGRTWYELRGWWEVNNDFMGGAFVSYSTLNEATNEITTIMFALYAPEEGQRNPLRELEHLIYTIK